MINMQMDNKYADRSNYTTHTFNYIINRYR